MPDPGHPHAKNIPMLSSRLLSSKCSPIARSGRKGAAVVEVAVVLPVFLLLVAGAIDVGRAIMVQHKLVEAARAGCRLYCVTEEQTEEDARAMIAKVMEDANLDRYAVDLFPDSSDDIEHKAPVYVTVSVPYDEVSWMSSWFLAGRTLSGTCVMPGDTGEVDLAADDDEEEPPGHDDGDDDEDDDHGRWKGRRRGWWMWWK